MNVAVTYNNITNLVTVGPDLPAIKVAVTVNPSVANIAITSGAKGDKGDKGDNGADGAQGVQGLTGATGAAGATGSQGAQGNPGSPASNIITSVFGRTGTITATANDYTFSQIGSKPTTISGYGITDTLTQVLTGYTSGSGIISATDTLIGAIQKLNGNIGLSALLGGSNTFTQPQIITNTSAVNSLQLINNVAATVTVSQAAGNLLFQGQGWKTNATAGPMSYFVNLSTGATNGAANPQPVFSLSYGANGAGLFTWMTLNATIQITSPGAFQLSNNGGPHINMAGNVTNYGQPTQNFTAAALVMSLGGSLLGSAAFLYIAAGTAAKAQLNLAASVAKTTPVQGDLYFDTSTKTLKFHDGTSLKTITMS